jgi:hypothetical protein
VQVVLLLLLLRRRLEELTMQVRIIRQRPELRSWRQAPGSHELGS